MNVGIDELILEADKLRSRPYDEDRTHVDDMLSVIDRILVDPGVCRADIHRLEDVRERLLAHKSTSHPQRFPGACAGG